MKLKALDLLLAIFLIELFSKAFGSTPFTFHQDQKISELYKSICNIQESDDLSHFNHFSEIYERIRVQNLDSQTSFTQEISKYSCYLPEELNQILLPNNIRSLTSSPDTDTDQLFDKRELFDFEINGQDFSKSLDWSTKSNPLSIPIISSVGEIKSSHRMNLSCVYFIC